MARNTKNNDPIATVIAIIIFVPIILIGFLIENLWAMALLVALAIGTVVFFIIKHKMFLNYYYDKERWKSMIDAPKQFDSNLTNEIENAVVNGTTVTLGIDSDAFSKLRDAYKLVFSSQEKIFGEVILYDDFFSCGRKLYVENNVGVKFECSPIIVRSADKKGRGLSLYIFPKTVLVFVEGLEKAVFIGAYYHDLLSMRFEDKLMTREVPMDNFSYDIADTYRSYCQIGRAHV